MTARTTHRPRPTLDKLHFTEPRTLITNSTALKALLGLLVSVSAVAGPNSYPSSADIQYEVIWGLVSLDAEQHWRVDGKQYTLTTELKLPLGFKNRRYVSRGLITEGGLEPTSYEDLQAGAQQANNLARFDRSAAELRYGSPDKLRSVKLEPLTQDLNALAFQLAWWGARTSPVLLPVTNGKGLVNYQFEAPSMTRLNFNGKELEALRYQGSSREGGIEVLIAPSMNNLPLMVVRSQDGRKLKFVAKQVSVQP
jgi:hypothetical protein